MTFLFLNVNEMRNTRTHILWLWKMTPRRKLHHARIYFTILFNILYIQKHHVKCFRLLTVHIVHPHQIHVDTDFVVINVKESFHEWVLVVFLKFSCLVLIMITRFVLKYKSVKLFSCWQYFVIFLFFSWFFLQEKKNEIRNKF